MATTDAAPDLSSVKSTIPAPTSPQSTLISTLITKSLTTLSYPPSTTSAVAALTHRNTHTITLTGLQPLLYHPSHTYGSSQALAQLFDNLAAKDVRINTNEPVLLVNSSTLSNAHLKEIAAAAANLLRNQYHIRPVRIYAGNFDSASASASELGNPKGFSGGAEGCSLSLLNVVNTDIGGPGMIQLTDMVDWEAAGAIKVEHWDGSGWNLVREVEYLGKDGEESAEEDGNGNRSESETEGSEKGEWESEAEAEPEEDGKEAEAEIGEEGDHVDTLLVPEVPDSQQEQDTDARPQLRSMKHPSWERSQDKESLLDMISNQAKRLPFSKSGNAYATSAAGKKEKPGLEGEDEYEVI